MQNKIIKNIINDMINNITSHHHLELNKIYVFYLGNMSHCGMNHQEMINHYLNNSSPLSFLIEKLSAGLTPPTPAFAMTISISSFC